jgi:hypothetical protein
LSKKSVVLEITYVYSCCVFDLTVLIKKILDKAKIIQYQQLCLSNKFDRDPTAVEIKVPDMLKKYRDSITQAKVKLHTTQQKTPH